MSLIITLFSSDKEMRELCKVEATHITSFDQSIVTLHMWTDQLMLLIPVLINSYVKFTVQGDHLELHMKEYQRVKIRIDPKSVAH